MVKCSYCTKEIKAGTGKLYVTKEGKAFDLCSSKCEKNKLMGRLARDRKWITKLKP